MKHPKALKELSKKMYYGMENYHQAVHDLQESLSVEITCFEPTISLTAIENAKVLNEAIASISYDIGNLLEVIDPKLTNDIWALNEMQKIIIMNTVTTYEQFDLNEVAKKAAEEKEAIESLDFHLLMLWKMCPFDFEASIKFMETALKFQCEDTAENIKQDLRKSNPYTWAAYVKDNFTDHSSADGSER